MSLTAAQRKILVEIVSVEDAPQELRVERRDGKPGVTLHVGKKRFESDQSVEALSVLYSRGLVKQESLNRFVATEAGRQAVRETEADNGTG